MSELLIVNLDKKQKAVVVLYHEKTDRYSYRGMPLHNEDKSSFLEIGVVFSHLAFDYCEWYGDKVVILSSNVEDTKNHGVTYEEAKKWTPFEFMIDESFSGTIHTGLRNEI